MSFLERSYISHVEFAGLMGPVQTQLLDSVAEWKEADIFFIFNHKSFTKMGHSYEISSGKGSKLK